MRVQILYLLMVVAGGSVCADVHNDYHRDVDDFDIVDVAARLDKHIGTLVQYAKYHNNDVFKNINNIESYVEEWCKALQCRHMLTLLCLQTMRVRRSVEPLWKTWNIFKDAYDDVDPKLFLQEFSRLTSMVYYALLSSVVCFENRVTVAQVQDSGALLAPLMYDVLKQLDRYSEQLGLILQHYSTSGSGWIMWLKEYWWVPPVAFFAIMYRIVLHKAGIQYRV